jgi:hypothetical protein
MSVSYVARRAGVAPSLLFNWRRRMLEGALQAVQADEDVVGTSRVRELEPGRTTNDVAASLTLTDFWSSPHRCPVILGRSHRAAMTLHGRCAAAHARPHALPLGKICTQNVRDEAACAARC